MTTADVKGEIQICKCKACDSLLPQGEGHVLGRDPSAHRMEERRGPLVVAEATERDRQN